MFDLVGAARVGREVDDLDAVDRHLVGGAAEFDAERAIEQGTRVVAGL